MTIEEAQAIIAKTKSPKLKKDMEKFIKRNLRKGVADGENRKTAERNKQSRV